MKHGIFDFMWILYCFACMGFPMSYQAAADAKCTRLNCFALLNMLLWGRWLNAPSICLFTRRIQNEIQLKIIWTNPKGCSIEIRLFYHEKSFTTSTNSEWIISIISIEILHKTNSAFRLCVTEEKLCAFSNMVEVLKMSRFESCSISLHANWQQKYGYLIMH